MICCNNGSRRSLQPLPFPLEFFCLLLLFSSSNFPSKKASSLSPSSYDHLTLSLSHTTCSSSSIMNSPQNSYIRAREDPYYDGLLRAHHVSKNQMLTELDPQGNTGSRSMLRSASDNGDLRSKELISDISETSMDVPLQDSISDIVHLEKFTIGSLSNIAKTTLLSFPTLQSALSYDSMDTCIFVKESSPRASETIEEHRMLPIIARPIPENSYIVTKRRPMPSNIALPQSAASFYNGFSPLLEIVEHCESIKRLNLYLKSSKDDVNAGVPGRFLHAVLGQDGCDVGSIASTIMYAFYLNETLENDQLCTVPVINMKRADLTSHAELKWLLDSCQIDESSLIFIDEVDLSYYDLFGSLKVVLVNRDKLPAKQEALKEAVVEIFNCRKSESDYPGVEAVTVAQDSSSCCTVVAEKFLHTSPEILGGHGFSRLLLAGILLDTANLISPNCTTKDKFMSTLLIKGAGRHGSNGLYQILRHKMYDVSDLKVINILRKDFKKWTRVGKADGVGSKLRVSNIGMSSIGISIQQLLAHDITSSQEIKYFQQLEKLRFLMVVSGYYDPLKNFKREILVAAESMELMMKILLFLNSNASQLPLKDLHVPGLKDEMRAFEIDRVTSRKTIERLLEEFGGAPKG